MLRRLRQVLCKLLRCHWLSQTAANSEPKGVQAFNRGTVYVLGRLYAEFPEPVDFEMLRIAIELAIDQHAADSAADRSPGEAFIAKHLSSTMRWLRSEGYIRAASENFDGDFIAVELTEKALRALGTV